MAGGIGGLQRSSVSFRRHGSSGMVWDDTRLIPGELILKTCPLDQQPHDHHREVIMLNVADGHQVQKRWSTKAGGGGGRGAIDFHAAAGKVAAANDPPSPRVSACGFSCTAFRKPNKSTITTTAATTRSTVNRVVRCCWFPAGSRGRT